MGPRRLVAPDWTADWLHREAEWLLDRWSRDLHGLPYDGLEPEVQAAMRARLREELRTNRFDPARGVITLSTDRAAAIAAVG